MCQIHFSILLPNTIGCPTYLELPHLYTVESQSQRYKRKRMLSFVSSASAFREYRPLVNLALINIIIAVEREGKMIRAVGKRKNSSPS